MAERFGGEMKSTFFLLKDIQNTLKEAFADVTFDAVEKENSEYKTVSPNIFIGHLPPKKSMPAVAGNEVTASVENKKAEANKTPSGDPPFIIVRLIEDEDNDNTKTHEFKVGILCCVYNRDGHEEIEAGYHDIYNMTDCALRVLVGKLIWQKFWTRTGNIKRIYGLQKELGSIYEAGAQGHEYFGSAVIATFTAQATQRPSAVQITVNN